MTRKTYPKRNTLSANVSPKYQGRKLWRNGDARMKCLDCIAYASHEALVRVPGNPFKAEHLAKTPVCPKHATKKIAEGIVERIHPYPEFLSWEREVADWESHQRSGVQGSLV
jgi:hypothetical protein